MSIASVEVLADLELPIVVDINYLTITAEETTANIWHPIGNVRTLTTNHDVSSADTIQTHVYRHTPLCTF